MFDSFSGQNFNDAGYLRMAAPTAVAAAKGSADMPMLMPLLAAAWLELGQKSMGKGWPRPQRSGYNA